MPRNAPQAPETLHEFLMNDTVSGLKPLLPLVTDERPTRKADICAAIEAVMLNPKAARSLWDQLDSTQQAAVSETLYDPSLTFHADQFRAKYGKLPEWNVSSEAEEDNHA